MHGRLLLSLSTESIVRYSHLQSNNTLTPLIRHALVMQVALFKPVSHTRKLHARQICSVCM